MALKRNRTTGQLENVPESKAELSAPPKVDPKDAGTAPPELNGPEAAALVVDAYVSGKDLGPAVAALAKAIGKPLG